MTNVKASDLNYNSYEAGTYDEDIRAVIPNHVEMHEVLSSLLLMHTAKTFILRVLDLGCGTGLTSELIRRVVPDAHLTLVDFSEQMLGGARARIGDQDVDYLHGDYSRCDLGSGYDLVVAFIGLHHQPDDAKKAMIKRIYDALAPGGLFVLGDLMDHADERAQALATAMHWHHMVEHLDRSRLVEWSHHHLFLNDCATAEDHMQWMKDAEFQKVELWMRHRHTTVISAHKEKDS